MPCVVEFSVAWYNDFGSVFIPCHISYFQLWSQQRLCFWGWAQHLWNANHMYEEFQKWKRSVVQDQRKTSISQQMEKAFHYNYVKWAKLIQVGLRSLFLFLGVNVFFFNLFCFRIAWSISFVSHPLCTLTSWSICKGEGRSWGLLA